MHKNTPIIQRTFEIPDAIHSLAPNAVWHSVDGSYETLVWESDDIPKPSLEDLEAEVLRLQTDWDENEYRRWRDVNYPPVGDQLDALFHAGVFPPEMEEKIRLIKEQYPKPEVSNA